MLHQHKITALADVRSRPYSRYLAHFNKAPLKSALNRAGIYYVFLGQELGARPDDQACYVDGKAVYEKIAATDAFHNGIQRALKGTHKHKVALMCAEKDPLTCHRAILVCQYLKEFNLDIKHILKGGALESHEHLEHRMLVKHRMAEPSTLTAKHQLSLFGQKPSNQQSKSELLREAYKLQGYEIAYVEQKGVNGEQTDQPVYNRIHEKKCSKVL